MVTEIKYTNIRRVLDNLHDEAMMEDVTLEQVVRHTIRFIAKFGMPKLYQDKEADVKIHEFRGLLPCDLISIVQVKDTCSGLCMRSMTDTFTPGLLPPPPHFLHPHMPYIPPMAHRYGDASFKTEGRVIFTSFPEGEVRIAYKAIPVDEDGFPLIIDNEVYLDALETYIAKKVLKNKFRKGDIPLAVYEDAKQEYAWNAGQLQSELTIPSYSEMQSITNYITSILPSVRHFDNGFRDLGSREYLRKH